MYCVWLSCLSEHAVMLAVVNASYRQSTVAVFEATCLWCILSAQTQSMLHCLLCLLTFVCRFCLDSAMSDFRDYVVSHHKSFGKYIVIAADCFANSFVETRYLLLSDNNPML